MRQLLPVLFCFYSLLSFGQNSLLTTAFSWFNKADTTHLKTYLGGLGYRLNQEEHALNSHELGYSQVKTENGTQPEVFLVLNDTSLDLIYFETYRHQEQQSILSQLKAKKFKLLTTEVSGDFIRTSYDNNLFIVQEDYQAVQNPLGKGEIPFYGYRIFRKYSMYDSMNGERGTALMDGTIILRENYKNGTLEGQRTLYSPNGTIKRTENYRAGRLNGIASDYNEDGKITHSTTHSYHWKYGIEKWYNNEGKVVRSLQWKRDVPVGPLKSTYSGTVIEWIPYQNGLKHGAAKVPVYYDAFIEANYPLDTLNDAPFGIETVNYEKGLKTGKAVCTLLNNTDTLYAAYYKAGELDSTFIRYGQEDILYTTNYSAGLENGARIFRIPSGPLKDSIYRIEQYTNGELDGSVIQYYCQMGGEMLADPDPGSRLPGDFSPYPNYTPGQWIPLYYSETYKNGEKNGPYFFQKDSLNYQKGTYLNGRLQGLQETGTLIGKKQLTTSGNYENGLRNGQWTTAYISDSMVITEQFENNLKHGKFQKTVHGFLTEIRVYESDTLRELTFLEKNTDHQWYSMEFLRNRDSIRVLTFTLQNHMAARFIYVLAARDYPLTDTLLVTLVKELQNIPDISLYLEGGFSIKSTGYALYGDYKNGKRHGLAVMEHYDASVSEKRSYQNGIILTSTYTRFDNGTLFSGIFTAAESGEQISVKNGLRNGWCVEYDASGKELRRTKYKNGVVKKTEERKRP